jgi:type I restriction enzyme S subunit
MTSRATIGAISINTTEACTNQGFITCVPNQRVPLSFLLHWLHANVPVFIAHATGSTFKEIIKSTFRRLPIVLPPEQLVAKYEAHARPLIDLVLHLEHAQHVLNSARDLLLPRLISGELSVSSAERELEAAE